MGAILMKMADFLKGNAFCVNGFWMRGLYTIGESIIGRFSKKKLAKTRIPRGRDPILSTQRIPRGRNRRGATL